MNILKPIEIILLAVFNLSYKCTSNYGISLLIMSVVITVGTYPLYYLADIWKEKELKVQKEMKSDIDKISKVYSGQKKFYLVQTTYRLHNYKSWYAFRTSLGILIQIPFFFAAYNVLSSYTGYAGCSFLFVNDLSKPDALFGSLNFLPLLMTLFNVLSSVIFTKSLKFKDNTQQFVLAIVFLLLLYNSPAALLIYWTSNNFLSIFKSLIRFFKNKEKINLDFNFKKDILESKTAKLTIIGFLFFATIYVLDTQNMWTRYCELFIALLNLIVFVFTYFYKREKLTIQKIVLYGLYGIGVCLYVLRKVQFLGIPFQVLLIFMGCVNLYYNFCYKSKCYFTIKEELLLDGLLIVLYSFLLPLNIFTGNIADFSLNIFSVVFSCLGISVLFCLAFFGIKFLFCKNSSSIIEVLFFGLVCYFAYTFVFKLDYGLMSEFSFQKDYNLSVTELWLYLKDFIILFLILLLVKYLLKGHKNYINISIYLSLCFFAVSVIVNIAKTDNSKLITKTEKKDSTYLDITKFSSNKQNVLYIMSDMMNGNYFERYINEKPETKDILEGFVWYKDTLSIASGTVNSMPVMYAGYEYTPEKLNSTGLMYKDAVIPGVKKYWENIIDSNYNISYITEWTGLDVDKEDYINDGYSEECYTVEPCTDYIDLYTKKHNIKKVSQTGNKLFLFEILPIFLSSPNTVKKYVYNGGLWNNTQLSINARREFSMVGVSYIDVFTDVAKIQETEKNSFIYVLSSLTHDSYGINENGELISNTKELADPNLPYYSAKKMLDEFVKIVEWLKQNNIYDNTLIVLCSDHGNWFLDNQLCSSFNATVIQKVDFARAYPMLLTKNFNSNDSLRISDSLMQNGDIYYYIKENVCNHGHEFSDFEKDSERKRYYYACNGNEADFNTTKVMKYTKYEVDGCIFDRESWDY